MPRTKLYPVDFVIDGQAVHAVVDYKTKESIQLFNKIENDWKNGVFMIKTGVFLNEKDKTKTDYCVMAKSAGYSVLAIKTKHTNAPDGGLFEFLFSPRYSSAIFDSKMNIIAKAGFPTAKMLYDTFTKER